MEGYVTMLELQDKIRTPIVFKGQTVISQAQFIINLFIKTNVYNAELNAFRKGKYKFKEKKL